MSEVGLTGLAKENEVSVFSKNYFQVGKFSFLFPGLFSLEGRVQIKVYCFKSGTGFWHWQLDNCSFGQRSWMSFGSPCVRSSGGNTEEETKRDTMKGSLN